MFASIVSWFIYSIIIERLTVGPGFDQSTTWTELATVDGYIWSLSGNESIDYGGDNVRSTHRAIMAVTDITEADRITVDDKTYLVRYVDKKALEGDEWLQVDVEYIGAAS